MATGGGSSAMASYHRGSDELALPKYSDELALLKYVHEHPSISTIRGNPAAVIAVIEEFASNMNRGLMTLGPKKRDHIINIFAAGAAGLSANTPKVFLEFGAYIGYSAIALGAALRELNLGQKVSYFSFEKNPLMAAITSSLVELAGLKDVVHVHVGPASESVVRLVAEGKLEKGSIDFMLLDHWKNVYVSDLQLCEELSLLREGSVVFADNILLPGAPEYLAYVKKGVAEKSAEGFRYETKTTDFVLPRGGTDQLAVSTVLSKDKKPCTTDTQRRMPGDLITRVYLDLYSLTPTLVS